MRRLLPLAALLLLAPGPAAARPIWQELEAQIIAISEQVKPAVVHVEAVVKVNDRRNLVTGSGVIVQPDGRILTNHHVVHRAEKITVTVPGHKKKYTAQLVGTDMQTDIAVLRITGDAPFPTVPAGSARDARVGQWVLAIGNPYGLDGTVSFGIISAQARDLELPDTLNEFIQTDAMIDLGSSGGPLVDLEGRLLGINSRGQGRGIGFTIPIETALEVADKLEAGGVERGFLGITMQPLPRELADYFGQPELTGALVSSVVDDSPAARAGIRTGDILTRFDGKDIEAEQEEDLGVVQRMVASVEPGQKAKVQVVRKGKARGLEVTLGTQPTTDPAEVESDVGFFVQEITARMARDHRLESDQGAFVYFVARGSPAHEAGLLPGDVIAEVEEQRVGDLDDFRKAMERVAGKPRFLITARRGEETRFVLIQRGVQPTSPPAPEGESGATGLR